MVWPAAERLSPLATPPARFRLFRSIWFCSKDITIRGMEIRTFTADHPDDAARDIGELQQMFADGLIQPYIGARFGLADAAAALRHVAERKAVGKVVIDVTA